MCDIRKFREEKERKKVEFQILNFSSTQFLPAALNVLKWQYHFFHNKHFTWTSFKFGNKEHHVVIVDQCWGAAFAYWKMKMMLAWDSILFRISAGSSSTILPVGALCGQQYLNMYAMQVYNVLVLQQVVFSSLDQLSTAQYRARVWGFMGNRVHSALTFKS